VFERILVPVDFSRGAFTALDAVGQIPGVREIVLLHVVYNRYPSKDPDQVPAKVQIAQIELDKVRQRLEMPGVTITPVLKEITGGEISTVIFQTAAQHAISLIIMGRRGTGIIDTLLLGSVASDVLRYGRSHLLLIPTPFVYHEKALKPESPHPALFSHVLVCTDFSEPEISVLCLNELPWIQRVSLFHVVTSGDTVDGIHTAVTEAEQRLARFQDMFSGHGIPPRVHVAVGGAVEEILSFSRSENVSLILMKSAGRKSFLNVLIGSTSAPVARNTTTPVLILRNTPVVRNE
jgi:nucleotide-binding universal stress UspA family protein